MLHREGRSHPACVQELLMASHASCSLHEACVFSESRMRYVVFPFMWRQAGKALISLGSEPALHYITDRLQRAQEHQYSCISHHWFFYFWPNR
jgi:hypothetical protein